MLWIITYSISILSFVTFVHTNMFEFERFGRTGRSWHSSAIWTLSPARRSSFLICWLPGKNQLASTAWHFLFRFGSFRTSVTSDASSEIEFPCPTLQSSDQGYQPEWFNWFRGVPEALSSFQSQVKKSCFFDPIWTKHYWFFTENVWRFWPWAKERMHSIAKQCQGQCKACKAFCTASTLCTVFVCHVARQLICWWWRERPDWLLNNYLVRCAAFRWEGLNIQGLTIHKAQLRL